MLKSPVEFVKDIEPGRHFVLFYENIEYSRSICFAFLKAGMENNEHSIYITAKEDKDFFKNEFVETMYGPNVIYEYNNTPNATFRESLFHAQNIPSLSDIHDNEMIDSIDKEIVNTINDTINSNNHQNDLSDKNHLSKNRVILRCLHKADTKEQIQKNIQWEKNFRNTKLREELPKTPIICTYPINDIIKILKGNSKLHSPWMTQLLEMYDGVIYARNSWTGAAFNFV